MLGKSITKNSLILSGFAMLTAGVLAITYQSTHGRIVEQEKRAAQKALLEIVPQNKHDNNMLSTIYSLPEALATQLNVSPHSNVYIATQKTQPVAAILPVIATDGYSGDIKFIIGINYNGTIAGLRILSHKETPGLGDKIDLNKSDWVLSFNEKSLNNPSINNWAVKKDGGQFDQFTGATITPRAIVNQVKTTLHFFNDNKESIFTQYKTQAE